MVSGGLLKYSSEVATESGSCSYTFVFERGIFPWGVQGSHRLNVGSWGPARSLVKIPLSVVDLLMDSVPGKDFVCKKKWPGLQ